MTWTTAKITVKDAVKRQFPWLTYNQVNSIIEKVVVGFSPSTVVIGLRENARNIKFIHKQAEALKPARLDSPLRKFRRRIRR